MRADMEELDANNHDQRFVIGRVSTRRRQPSGSVPRPSGSGQVTNRAASLEGRWPVGARCPPALHPCPRLSAWIAPRYRQRPRRRGHDDSGARAPVVVGACLDFRMMRVLRSWPLLAALAVGALDDPAAARAAAPILHEPIPPDPGEDLALGVALDGDLPAALRTPNGLV